MGEKEAAKRPAVDLVMRGFLFTMVIALLLSTVFSNTHWFEIFTFWVVITIICAFGAVVTLIFKIFAAQPKQEE